MRKECLDDGHLSWSVEVKAVGGARTHKMSLPKYEFPEGWMTPNQEDRLDPVLNPVSEAYS